MTFLKYFTQPTAIFRFTISLSSVSVDLFGYIPLWLPSMSLSNDIHNANSNLAWNLSGSKCFKTLTNFSKNQQKLKKEDRQKIWKRVRFSSCSFAFLTCAAGCCSTSTLLTSPHPGWKCDRQSAAHPGLQLEVAQQAQHWLSHQLWINLLLALLEQELEHHGGLCAGNPR